MRKLVATLHLLFWLACVAPAFAENSVGPTNQVVCNKQALFTGTGSAAQVVAGVTGQSIFICGWHVTNTAASGSFQLLYGTGSTCTSPTNITPVLSVSNTAPSADHITAAWFNTPAGATLCSNATVTTVIVMVFYAQF
jgi:hypothetical protein